MGKEQRGKRDGTGSYKDSYMVKVAKQPIGTRKQEAEDCPFDVETKTIW